MNAMYPLRQHLRSFNDWCVQLRGQTVYVWRQRCFLDFPINKASLFRWLAVLLYAVIAFPVIALIFQISYENFFLFRENEYFPFGDERLLVGVGLVLTGFVFWIAGFRSTQILRALRYPGFPVAVLAAFLFHWLLLSWSTELARANSEIFRDITKSYAAGLFLIGMYAAYRESKVESTYESKTILATPRIPLKKMSDDQLVKWVNENKEISERSEDYFDFGPRAHRVWDILRRRNRNCIAVVGPFGSGKSSLLNMVETEARREQARKPADQGPLLWFCHVSCWGIEEGDSAPEIILRQVVQQLGDHIDCLTLRGLPSRYASGFSKLHSFVEALFSLARPGDPTELLKSLSTLLQAVNVRLVIILEDIDRNGADFDPHQIEGLLIRLREVNEISFILAAGQNCKIDLLRLVDHAEVLPTIDRNVALEIIEKIREGCLRDPNLNCLVGSPTLISDGSNLNEATELHQRSKWGYFPHDNWRQQLPILLSTPRGFKAALRRFHLSWQKLKGEVNIDQLLVAAALREQAPNHFAFVQRHWNDFTWLGKDKEGEGKTNPVAKSLREEWQGLSDSGADRIAMQRLLVSIFPVITPLIGESHPWRLICTQDISNVSRGAVYRDRIFNEHILPGTLLDQPMIQRITRASQDSQSLSELAERIIRNKDEFDLFDFFRGGLLEKSCVLLLLSTVFTQLRRECGKSAKIDPDRLRRLCVSALHDSGLKPDEFNEWVKAEVLACIPCSLGLAANMVFYFLPDRKSRNEMFREATLKMESCFAKASVADFVQSLDETSPDTLSKFFPPNIDASKWFGPLIVEAIKVSPEIVIPETICLVLPVLNSDAEFEEDSRSKPSMIWNRIFGSYAVEILNQLKHYKDSAKTWKIGEGTYIRQVELRSLINRWLEHNGKEKNHGVA